MCNETFYMMYKKFYNASERLIIFLKVLTTHARSKSNAYSAKRIVGSGCDFSGAPGAMSIAIY